MPTLNQVRTRCDDFLSQRWPGFLAAQESFLALHGRYWQGLITHSIPPNHTTSATNDVLPDLLARRPTDQSETWEDFLPSLIGVSHPVALVVDVYEVAAGHGFAASLFVRYNGNMYRRVQAHGPLSGEYNRPWARFDQPAE